jgi:Protein of unknown function (DUF2924)
MKRVSDADREGLGEELKRLPDLDRNNLAERWVSFFGQAPPPRTSRSLMFRAVAYKMQERAFGGLRPTTRRLLREPAPTRSAAEPSRKLSPGTLLLREWRGFTHQVSVIEDGIVYRGKRYRSLSEVAFVITGSRWSGPRFFGLKAKHDRG